MYHTWIRHTANEGQVLHQTSEFGCPGLDSPWNNLLKKSYYLGWILQILLNLNYLNYENYSCFEGVLISELLLPL